MSWKKLLADKRVTRVPPSKAELDNLRSIVTRSIVKTAPLPAGAQFLNVIDSVFSGSYDQTVWPVIFGITPPTIIRLQPATNRKLSRAKLLQSQRVVY
jgi:hypothetical protein